MNGEIRDAGFVKLIHVIDQIRSQFRIQSLVKKKTMEMGLVFSSKKIQFSMIFVNVIKGLIH